jgi:GT2 family glycosyltransferase
VVDQSSNDDTAREIEQFLENPRLRYVRSNTVGLGVAHNVGLAHARADIVAMTDDDCEVDNNWMREIAAVFAQNPRVAVVYCNVVPVLADPSLGFVPSYVSSSSRLMTQMRDFCAPHGIGAGLAVRRKVLMEKGGFDNLLGSGGRFPSFEDSDVALRALAMGYHVYHTHKTNIPPHRFQNVGRRPCARQTRLPGYRRRLRQASQMRRLAGEPAVRLRVRDARVAAVHQERGSIPKAAHAGPKREPGAGILAWNADAVGPIPASLLAQIVSLSADRIRTVGDLRRVVDSAPPVSDETSGRFDSRRPQLLRAPMTPWP